MLSPQDIRSLVASAGPRNVNTPFQASAIQNTFGQVSSHDTETGMNLGALGIGCGPGGMGHAGAYGLGAKLNPNQAPQGQHANTELAGKLSQAKAADTKLSALIASINSALQANQALLLSSPQTAGVVTSAGNALADLQNAQSSLEASFWNGQNFNSFQGSSDAWNLMDQATSDALAKIGTYQNVPTSLAGSVATAQSNANAAAAAASAAQQAANQAAAAQAAAVQSAQNTVNNALSNASISVASGDFAGALAALGDPNLTAAAATAGMTGQVQSAIANVGRQKQASDAAAANAAAQTAANAAAQQAAQANAAQIAQANAANTAAQASAAATTAQGQFSLQQFQAQLLADAQARQDAAASADAQSKAQLAADHEAHQALLDQLQLILTAAPILGQGEVAAAFTSALGIDPNAANQAASQAGAGTASGDVPMSGDSPTGFYPETNF